MAAGAPTPDPELDALIAEHIMGWVRNRYGRLWPDRKCFGYRNSRGHGFIAPYSTDPTAAMTVIETLSHAPYDTRLECLTNRDGEYNCTLARPGRRKSETLLYSAHAPWPARAICLAALKTIEPAMQSQAKAGSRAAKKTISKRSNESASTPARKTAPAGAGKKKRSAS